jgi:hypothetical protein
MKHPQSNNRLQEEDLEGRFPPNVLYTNFLPVPLQAQVGRTKSANQVLKLKVQMGQLPSL